MNSKHQFIKIKECIQQNYHSYKFTISSLCEFQNISRATLHRILKEYTGQSTTSYINEIRLREAYAILQIHEIPIKDVAKKVGYFDPKYFSKIFKKKFGINPSQIRVKY